MGFSENIIGKERGKRWKRLNIRMTDSDSTKFVGVMEKNNYQTLSDTIRNLIRIGYIDFNKKTTFIEDVESIEFEYDNEYGVKEQQLNVRLNDNELNMANELMNIVLCDSLSELVRRLVNIYYIRDVIGREVFK